MTAYLTLEDVLEIVGALSAQVRDPGLLASAVARPQMTVFGEDAYPDLTTKAAALVSSLVRNHALVDGNKRLSWIALRLFLRLNDRDAAYSIDDAEVLVLAAAQGHLEVNELAADLNAHLHVRPSR